MGYYIVILMDVFYVLQKNESIQELILAHNNLGDSGLAVGAALGKFS